MRSASLDPCGAYERPPGRTLLVCTGDLVTSRDGEERAVATMLATVMGVRDRPELAD